MIARANRKMKEEMRKNNFKEEPTYYIDRDRAAATVAGSCAISIVQLQRH